MIDLEKIVSDLSSLTVLQVSELSKMLETKWGVSLSKSTLSSNIKEEMQVSKNEQTEFDIILLSFGDKKMEIIKIIKEVTSLGLKESKDLVESSPKCIKSAVKKEEAEDIKIRLESAGAKVELK